MRLNLQNNFPILQEKIHGTKLIYFDNAATTQKPLQVIDAIKNYYLHSNANIHRGVHTLAERATFAYENCREKVRNFINARSTQEIIFVRGTTEAINLVAQSYGRPQFRDDDEIIISTMEHHSNIVPWQLVCEQTGAKLQVIKIHENGELDYEHFLTLLNRRTKLVAITHVSNSLGTINPVKKIIAAAHANNVPVLIDGAQAVPHMSVDVQDLDCDFYAFSAHKMYGPTGVGVLYGKLALLEAMPPYQGGGDMIRKVTFAHTDYAELPQKFEAGTQNIANVVGFDATLDYLKKIGLDKIAAHEHELLQYCTNQLSTINGLKIIGTATNKASVISLVFERVHPHDVATILDTQGIAVRAGHHCNMPLMDHYHLTGTTRVSLGLYNTCAEIDTFIKAIDHIKMIFH